MPRKAQPGERLQITLVLPPEELVLLLQDARDQERTAAAEVRYIVRRYLAEMNGEEHA